MKKTDKKIFIITGLSGAGKTKALQTFGDFGFYCVDNLPLALFEDFSKHIKNREEENIALGVDIREGKDLKTLPRIVKDLKKSGFYTYIIFLNASDSKLVQRFSETKHKHPIQKSL
ncbi:RNase adaptor protein for sRNA GlmZ degradation [Elusimicrobium simillimum]|uniref:RNase adapter RapZ n=1 Tax=Elusimicrobium simillimum TaxID=3143438 RepID=UPI003C6EB6BC